MESECGVDPYTRGQYTCSTPAEYCRAGTPWISDDLGKQIMVYGEPLPQIVIDTAAKYELNPHGLDWHVEGMHGWEPHDQGYDLAVEQSAQCIISQKG